MLGVRSGVVKGVVERMLQLVPVGTCLPAKADLRLFRDRRGGEAELCQVGGWGGMSFSNQSFHLFIIS